MPSVTNKSGAITPVIVALSYRFVVGVDTHAATHSYAVLDAAGRVIDEQTFPTTSAGLSARDWIARRTRGDIDGVLVAVEGAGSYGAVLSESLAGVGYRVVEAPMPRRERGRGKTDAMDAVTAARNTLSMPIARLRDRRGGQDQVALQVLTTAVSSSTRSAYVPSTRSQPWCVPTTWASTPVGRWPAPRSVRSPAGVDAANPWAWRLREPKRFGLPVVSRSSTSS